MIYQLAKKEIIKNKRDFVKVDNPDSRIECYIVLENEEELEFRSKWFLSTSDET